MNNVFQEPKKILLSNNEEVVLPRLTLGKINAVAGSIAQFIKAVREHDPNLTLDWDEMEKNPTGVVVKLLKILPAVLPVLSKEIIIIIAAYLNKKTEWVEDNMDLEDLAKVATPFLVNIFQQGSLLFEGVKNLANQGEKPNETPKQ